jgi:glycosyltransferase involved in cell wall biosynthesis
MNINLYAPIGGTGYGVAGLNIYKHLYRHDNQVSLFPIGSPSVDDTDTELVRKGIDNQATFDYNAPCIKIWHQFDLANKIGKGRYLAYPFFELNKFNSREKHHLNFPDDLIVSCSWAKDILIDNNINKPIHIVPLGVDRKIFDSDELSSNNKIEDKYIFITVGKWEKRKSHDLIIELFNKAFELSDNVELWMVTFNPFLPKEIEQLWHDLVINSKMRNKIKIFPRISSQLELARLINYAHCGLYISRAEGWNLDLLETMSLNKPVIVTNYSAHTEFCSNTNSFLVDITELEDANDGLWFNGFGQWAKIGDSQQEQIIEHMRNCYHNRIITNPSGVETAKIFSWENSASILSGCIA